jgi:hypothetical protein
MGQMSKGNWKMQENHTSLGEEKRSSSGGPNKNKNKRIGGGSKGAGGNNRKEEKVLRGEIDGHFGARRIKMETTCKGGMTQEWR